MGKVSTMYKTTELRQIFGVSRQTVANWCKEFADYLSPTATPQNNARRQLTEDDLRVLSLISEMTGQGRTFEDIHLALAAGQRGDVITPSDQPSTALMAVEQQRKFYMAKISEIEERLNRAVEEKLQAEMEKSKVEGKLEHANQEIADLKKEVRNLYRELFEWQAKAKTTTDD